MIDRVGFHNRIFGLTTGHTVFVTYAIYTFRITPYTDETSRQYTGPHRGQSRAMHGRLWWSTAMYTWRATVILWVLTNWLLLRFKRARGRAPLLLPQLGPGDEARNDKCAWADCRAPLGDQWLVFVTGKERDQGEFREWSPFTNVVKRRLYIDETIKLLPLIHISVVTKCSIRIVASRLPEIRPMKDIFKSLIGLGFDSIDYHVVTISVCKLNLCANHSSLKRCFG